MAFCFQLLRYFVSNFCGKFIKGRQTKYQMRQTKNLIPCIKPIIFLNGADTGLEPARVFPWRPKSYIVLSFLWKSKAYPLGTGQKIAYLFPAQGTKKCQSIAYIGFCEQAADGHGKPVFETCQMMVFHQLEPPSFPQAS